jgi:DMSO/TMAO reductase YedYZ molybdopterin-dependent catalytic subunit/thiosulfate reductase cytochrome b subunit
VFSLATSGPIYFVGITHFLSVLLLTFLVRSGLEILSACPRLWARDDCEPGTEWLRLTRRRPPTDRLWTTLEEEESWSPWLALPGRKNLGLGRLWHFLAAGLWIVNGLVYYVLLFASGEWRRLIPTSWDIVPRALHTAAIYARFHLPPRGDPYNPLQQLGYAAVAFVFPAFMIATGLALSPGIAARFPWFPRAFGSRQVARSLHFLGLVAILGFVVVHVFLVVIEGFAGNVSFIMFGSRDGSPALALGLLAGWLALTIVAQVAATLASLRFPRRAQRVLTGLVTPVRAPLFQGFRSVQDYPASRVSRRLRVNGWPPDTAEFLALQDAGFRDWRLRVGGLVARPLELSLADLRAMPAREQTTLHNCIQGWSGVARWRGVPLAAILDLCRPLDGARHVVFHSHQWFMGHPFYETLAIELARDSQTILAYEMNGRPLPVEYGAPLRLRVENQLGFKMVKHLAEIELVASYELIGQGQGGHREDHRFFGVDAGI